MKTHPLFLSIAAVMLLLSGAAALMYQIVWVRYLCLIFGGSHLAVTTVLAVFMGGLALGSYCFGSKITEKIRPFRVYAGIEFGIALAAILFLVLMKYYPPIYIFLAQTSNPSSAYLTAIRILLTLIALIVPTTLMGGTLPILSNLLSSRDSRLGVGVSLLYAVNTLGAVVGAAIAGFVLIPYYSVTVTLAAAVATNLAVGLLCIILDRMTTRLQRGIAGAELPSSLQSSASMGMNRDNIALSSTPRTLVLWGIGISGFCAMGYEILWTRILSIIAGASVYAFTLMLMAFLTGISIGSSAYGILTNKLCRKLTSRANGPAIAFGLVQIIIGAAAYMVSGHLYEMPSYMNFLLNFLHERINLANSFETGQLVNFTLIFTLMLVPAFFMGLSFPLAVAILTEQNGIPSRTVGRILSSNTVGAIIGSASCGYFLAYLVGLQRSLQLLIVANIGLGLIIIVSTRRNALALRGTALFVLLSFCIPVYFPGVLSLWSPKTSAIYQRGDDTESERFQDTMVNFEVLYHGEGMQELVSSIHNYGEQFFITNGRIEASNDIKDMKLQLLLGHLPMLLNKNPRTAFVLGTGTGMTMGAIAAHPSIEQITLAEIEPKMINVARTFGLYNHHILDNPKLRIFFNDGRNYLMTSKDKFDVITADPVHPWFSGTGYLYSREYFRLVAEHLSPGGIACQWLPLYELSAENIKSVMKTFSATFRYSMLWYAQEDAILIGSDSPLRIDESDFNQRLRAEGVQSDLLLLRMGSAGQFLSSFVMGDIGIKAYSGDGRINTDDNLYLEFSAPRSIGKYNLTATNISSLARHRENILPYLTRPADKNLRLEQQQRWESNNRAAQLNDRAHVLFILGGNEGSEFKQITAELDEHFADYAPWKFFADTTQLEIKKSGQQIESTQFELLDLHGHTFSVNLAAVFAQEPPKRATLSIMETTTQFTYGRFRLSGQSGKEYAQQIARDIMASVNDLYRAKQQKAFKSGKVAPLMSVVLPEVKLLVAQKLALR